MDTSPQPHIVFKEPRLAMSMGGRVVVRLISIATYGVLGAGTIVLILNDIPLMRSLGILFALFLFHRLITSGHADSSLPKLGINNLRYELSASRRGRVPDGAVSTDDTATRDGSRKNVDEARNANRKKINIARYLSPQTYKIIEYAFEHASWTHNDLTLLLMKRLLERHDTKETMRHLDIDPDAFTAELQKKLKAEHPHTPSSSYLKKTQEIAEKAFAAAVEQKDRFVLPRHLLMALENTEHPTLRTLFGLFNIQPGELGEAAKFTARPRKHYSHPSRIHHRVMNRAWTARPTPALDAAGINLTDLARKEKRGSALIGHENSFEELLDILARPGNAHALLVGETGIGKSALLEHLAYRVMKDEVPRSLFDKRVVTLEIGNITAGADEPEVEARLKRILQEITSAGNIILVIPHIHNLLKTGGKDRMRGADILLPAIESNAFPVIGVTTPQDMKTTLESAEEIVSGFGIVRMHELKDTQAIELLTRISGELEDEYKVLVSFKAIRNAVLLGKQFLRETPLPSSAISLLKEAFAETVRRGEKVVREEEVRRVVERETQIPLRKSGKDEQEKLLHLEEYIHARFVDQEEAVHAVSRALREYRAGLAEKATIANFLFVGPTGVGKTELAKLVAEVQFGNPHAMIRLDMSEYNTKEGIARLIGTRGEETSRGALTEMVREKPYSLILLDEFEKAHPDVINLFLQVFDEGILMDAKEREIHFDNTIIIATSNAHSDIIQAAIEKGETATSVAQYLKTKLTDYFPIELLNRFTDIIVFHNLSLNDLKQVVRIQLRYLADTLKNQGIEIHFDESVVDALAKWGYDPQFGARPLKRAIEEHIKDPLSESLLKGEISPGDTVSMQVVDEKIKIGKKLDI